MDASRRKFLLGSTASLAGGWAAAQLPPVEKLIHLLLRETLQSASAVAETTNMKYVQVHLSGAPGRWVFDQFLQTKPGQSVSVPLLASTNFVSSNGQYQSLEYRTINYNGVLVPPIWGTQVAGGGGGNRALSDLLKHMIVFRGYGTGIDGHPSNSAKQTNPVPGAGSLDGHVADLSSSLFKAMQYPSFSTSSGYSSPNGTGLSVVSCNGATQNCISQVLYSFGARSGTDAINALRDKYSELINNAQATLGGLANADHSDFSSVTMDQQQALKKIKAGVDGLDAQWSTLYSKYLNIFQTTFRDRTSAGFNDQPIVTEMDDGHSADSIWSIMAPDASTLYPAPGQDIRDWVINADLNYSASTFALAEYVLVNNLVSAFDLLMFDIPNLSGMFTRSSTGSITSPTQMSCNHSFDQHYTGAMTVVYLNSCLMRSIGAALLELISQLQGAGQFNNTVIHLTQDFGRSPRKTSGGADHNVNGMIGSVFSGLVNNGPLVLGNIVKNGTQGFLSSNYPGTFGYQAPTNVSGSMVNLTPAHVTSSIAVLLGLPTNPWGNVAAPLISVGNGGVTANASAEIVDI